MKSKPNNHLVTLGSKLLKYPKFYYKNEALSSRHDHATHGSQIDISEMLKGKKKCFRTPGKKSKQEKKLIICSDWSLRFTHDPEFIHAVDTIIQALLLAGFKLCIWNGEKALEIASPEAFRQQARHTQAALPKKIHTALAGTTDFSGKDTVFHLDYFTLRQLISTFHQELKISFKIRAKIYSEETLYLSDVITFEEIPSDIEQWLNRKRNFSLSINNQDPTLKEKLFNIAELMMTKYKINRISVHNLDDQTFFERITSIGNIESIEWFGQGNNNNPIWNANQNISFNIQYLKKLTIVNSKMTNQYLSKFFSYAKCIENVRLNKCHNISYLKINNESNFLNLHSLVLEDMVFDIENLLNILIVAKNLANLNFDNINFIGQLSLNLIKKVSVNLKRFEVKKNKSIYLTRKYKTKIPKELILKILQSKNLETLNLEGLANGRDLTPAYFTKTSKFPRLQTLKLTNDLSKSIVLPIGTYLKLISLCPKVTEIDLRLTDPSDIEGLKADRNSNLDFSHIKILAMGYHSTDPRILKKILPSLRAITEIALDTSSKPLSLTPTILNQAAFNQLSSIDLNDIGINGDFLSKLLSKAPNLSRILSSFCKNLSSFNMSQYGEKVSRNLRNIKIFTLIQSNMPFKEFVWCLQFTKVNTLDLSGMLMNEEINLTEFNDIKLKHLKKLKIPEDENIPPAYFKIILQLSPNLEIIKQSHMPISHNKNSEGDSENIIDSKHIPDNLSLPHLRELKPAFSKITGAAVLNLIKASRGIEVLDLSGCRFVGDLTPNLITPDLPFQNLKYIRYHNSTVPFATIMRIVSFSPHISGMDNSDKEETSEYHINLLQKHDKFSIPKKTMFKYITSVDLSHPCTGMNVKFICRLLNRLPHAESISIRLPSFPRQKMYELRRPPTSLKHLSILNALRIDMLFIENLIRLSPKIETLYITDLTYQNKRVITNHNEKKWDNVKFSNLFKIEIIKDFRNFISPNFLHYLIFKAANLKILSLTSIDFSVQYENPPIDKNQYRLLEKISLSDVTMYNNFLKHLIQNAKTLHHLSIVFCTIIPISSGMSWLDQLANEGKIFSNLKYLSFTSSNNYQGGLNGLHKLFPNLNSLNISNFEKFSNNQIDNKIKFLKLKHITIYGSDVPLLLIRQLLLCSPILQSVQIFISTNKNEDELFFSDKEINQLSKNIRKFIFHNELNRKHTLLRSNIMSWLLANPDLKELKLTKCTISKCDAVDSRATFNAKGINSLGLCDVLIDSITLRAMLNYTKNITSLNLDYLIIDLNPNYPIDILIRLYEMAFSYFHITGNESFVPEKPNTYVLNKSSSKVIYYAYPTKMPEIHDYYDYMKKYDIKFTKDSELKNHCSLAQYETNNYEYFIRPYNYRSQINSRPETFKDTLEEILLSSPNFNIEKYSALYNMFFEENKYEKHNSTPNNNTPATITKPTIPKTKYKKNMHETPINKHLSSKTQHEKYMHYACISEDLSPDTKLFAKKYFLPDIDPGQYRSVVCHSIETRKNKIFLLECVDKNFVKPNTRIQYSKIPLESIFNSLMKSPPKPYSLCKKILRISNEWQPLPSLSAHEKITYFYTNYSQSIEITYSKTDSLYYIRGQGPSQKIKIQFILDFNDEPKQNDRRKLPKEINELIQHCSTANKGELVLPPYASAIDILNERYEQQIYSCLQRAIVFYERLKRLHKQGKCTQYQCRIVYNKLHTFIEFENGDRYDLGGSEVKVILTEIEGRDLYDSSSLEKVLGIGTSLQQLNTASHDNTGSTYSSLALPSNQPAYNLPLKSDLDPALTVWKNKIKKAPDNITDLFNIIIKPGANSLLMLDDPNDALSLITLFSSHYRQSHRSPYFYIDDVNDLQLAASGLTFDSNFSQNHRLNKSKNATALNNYLEQYPNGVLFINFCHASTTQIAQLHCIIDSDKRQLNSMTLPKDLKIVIFYSHNVDNPYTDRDFKSRLHYIFNVPKVKDAIDPYLGCREERTIPVDKNLLSIELFNSDDWESLLFGAFDIQLGQFTLEPTSCLKRLDELENLLLTLHLNNPPWHLRNFQLFWQQALQQKQFQLYGKTFYLAKDFTLTYSNHPCWKISVIRPSNEKHYRYPLNRYTFYTFFNSYFQKKGFLSRNPGLLQEHGALNLVVNENLPTFDWMRLLNTATELSLTLVEGVTLPEALSQVDYEIWPSKKPLSIATFTEIDSCPFGIVYAANNDEMYHLTGHLLNQYPEALYIRLDKLHNYGELFYQIEPNIESECITTTLKKGAAWRALKSGKTVIIEGSLSPDLVNALSPMLITGKPQLIINGKLKPFKGQLFFVTDTEIPYAKNIFSMTHNIQPLPRSHPTDHKKYEIRIKPETRKPASTKKQSYDLYPISDYEAYRLKRFKTITNGFSKSPLLSVVGNTGVGKSTYFKDGEFKEDYFNYTGRIAKLYYYNELAEFAAHRDTQTDPFLIIDEANMQNGLSRLKSIVYRASHPHLLLENGQHYPIYGRVFLISNPIEYGGARHHQAFFDQYCETVPYPNPTDPYLYYKILKPQLTRGFVCDAEREREEYEVEDDPLTPQMQHQLARIAKVILAVYHKVNDIAKNSENSCFALRHLHMMVVLYHAYNNRFNRENQFGNDNNLLIIGPCVSLIGDHFSTQQFNQFIQYLSEKYHYNDSFFKSLKIEYIKNKLNKYSRSQQPGEFVITESHYLILELLDLFLSIRKQDNLHSGLLLQGPTGMGKSALFTHYLELLQIPYVQLSFSPNEDADLEILASALDQRKVILLDESNVGLAGGRERWINLMIDNSAGSLILATQNLFAFFAGRQQLSPALQARFLPIELPEFTYNDIIEILKSRGVPPKLLDYWAKQFIDCRRFAISQHLDPPNLRDLFKAVKKKPTVTLQIQQGLLWQRTSENKNRNEEEEEVEVEVEVECEIEGTHKITYDDTTEKQVTIEILIRASKYSDVMDMTSIKRCAIRLNQLTDKNHYGYTPIVVAAAQNKLDIIRWLIKSLITFNQAECNKDEVFCLRNACGEKNIHLVQWLYENGFYRDLNEKDCYGCTALHYACETKEIVEFLVDKGAILDVKNNTRSLTPLLLATQHRYFETVEFLLENGADADMGNEEGLTPLRFALKLNDTKMLKLFIDYGYGVFNVLDTKGEEGIYSTLLRLNFKGCILIGFKIMGTEDYSRKRIDLTQTEYKADFSESIMTLKQLKDALLAGKIEKKVLVHIHRRCVRQLKTCEDNTKKQEIQKLIKTIDCHVKLTASSLKNLCVWKVIKERNSQIITDEELRKKLPNKLYTSIAHLKNF